ncbi:MAG: PAS domain S-box protein [Bacteroidales bacterium]|nr:PAS domain S-box protein [Bacteroidales bacterium]
MWRSGQKNPERQNKPLECLNRLSQLLDDYGLSENDLLQAAVELIPFTFPHPNEACARIQLSGKEFKTKGYKETSGKLSTKLILNNKTERSIEVFYPENLCQLEKGITPEESAKLLETFAKSLAKGLEQRQNEEELKKNRELLSKTQDLAQIGIWEYDLVSDHVTWTDQVYRIFGLNPQEFGATYQAFLDHVHPDDRKKVNKAYSDSVEEGKDMYEVEHRVVRKNTGEVLFTHGKCFHERGQTGKIVRSIGLVQDVTKSTKTKEKLRKSEYRLRSTLNNMKEGCQIISFDWRYLFVNDEVATHARKTKSELLGKTMMEVYPGIEKTAMFKVLQQCMEERTTHYFENEFTYPDGSYGWFDLTIQPSPEGIMVFSVDITERKQAEKELQKLYDDIFLILKSSPTALALTRVSDGKFITINDTYTTIMGYHPHEVVGHTVSDLNIYVNDNERDQLMKILQDEGRVWNYELDTRHKNGTVRNLLVSMEPIIYNGEKTLISTFVDITEKKKMYEDLKKAKEKAEESDRLKSAFLANMSHEIRTPMNGILGFTNLLREPGISGEEKDRYTEIIEKSGERMLDTVNDIVEISKIEAGILSVEKKQINVNDCVNDLVQFFSQEAKNKGLELSIDHLLPENSAIIITDQSKLESILSNLIKNAIKYTFEGSIKVGCHIQEEYIEFYVKDTGVGIPGDRQEVVFNRFEQADISDTSAFEGSGLGLAISRSLVDMLNGSIWLDSKVDKGSTFYFTIPVHREAQPSTTGNTSEVVNNENQAYDEKPPNKLKILIAEDDQVSFNYLSTLLKRIDCEIIRAINGTEAVQYYRDNPDIDLILMDVKMPEMDGYKATRKIREIDEEVPVIAQTAYAITGDGKRALEAGCDDYIPKPIKKHVLMQKINKLVKTG